MAIVLLMCRFKTVILFFIVVQGTPTHGSRCPVGGQVEPMKKIKRNVIFILSERSSSRYFMPVCYLFLQLSFAIQKIIQFHSDLTGGWKIENDV